MVTHHYLCALCLNCEKDWVEHPDGAVDATEFCLYRHPCFPAARACTDYEPTPAQDSD